MLPRTALVLLSAVVLIATVGCSENLVTRHNYDMIKRGKSTRLEVEKTLGDTYTQRGEDQWEYEEMDRHLSVCIHFDENGKVKKKEWIDAKTGEWHTDPAEPAKGRKISDETGTTTIKEP